MTVSVHANPIKYLDEQYPNWNKHAQTQSYDHSKG